MYSFKMFSRENKLLWTEVGDLRDQHREQQSVINKVYTEMLLTSMSHNDISKSILRAKILLWRRTLYEYARPVNNQPSINKPSHTRFFDYHFSLFKFS